MRAPWFLLVAVALICLSACQHGRTPENKAIASGDSTQTLRCNDLAHTWADSKAMAADTNTQFTAMLAGYSPAKQSCIVYYNYQDSTVATYFVEDLTTHAPYSNEACSKAQRNCAAAMAKSKAVFDELTSSARNSN